MKASLRSVAINFFKLKLSDKIDIAKKLNISLGDGSLSDLDRFKAVLKQAQADGKLEDLAREVATVAKKV